MVLRGTAWCAQELQLTNALLSGMCPCPNRLPGGAEAGRNTAAMAHTLAAALLALSVAAPQPPGGSTAAGAACRCTPGQACWAAVPWRALNVSVGGRLVKSVDELQPCIDDEASEQCTAALNMTDDEFWLGSTPNGYQHTGLFGGWNTSTDRSEYSVKAQTEQDFVETVKFAGEHNLRLVVKATGHDWYGRSTAAGSLLLWTHQRKKITWHTSFPEGAGAGAGVPAVTVESGVQFSDLYPAAQTVPYPGDTADPQRKTVVMGGTCDSVGVGGCWLGGCYGPFTKKFGNGSVSKSTHIRPPT